MFAQALLLPLLAVARGVSAATNSCSTTATLTIQNSGDAGALSGCTTYTGSIAVATGTTDPINIGGVQEIQGNLIANNASNLPSLGADSLKSITGTFQLAYLTVLTSLTFPRLAKVGTIDWTTVPRVNSLTFTSGVKQASNVRIVDTGLYSLSGIQLTTVDTMIVSSNGQLQSLDMPLEAVRTLFRAEFNSPSMNITLPNLEYAYNATFRNVSGVSIPSLKSVNDSMGFNSNFFTSISAPNLTTVGTTLSIISNAMLTNVSFPLLTSLGVPKGGALQIANNTNLNKIDGFPDVNSVNGAVDVVGNFTDFTLPALGQNGGSGVAGAFNLQSLSDIKSVCDHFAPLQGQSATIRGKYTCITSKNPTTVDGTAGASGSSSTTTGAASHSFSARSYAVTGLLGVVAAIFGMF